MSIRIEVISLIYKSPRYLKHICSEIQKMLEDTYVYDVKVSGRIVANDPSIEVLDALPSCGLPYTVYIDPNPRDYYLNRVYRCWNHAGKTSDSDLVVFINSDMAFYNGIHGLVECYNEWRCVVPCSFLVEAGVMHSAPPCLVLDCGKDVDTFDREKFSDFAKQIDPRIQFKFGLFMPCMLHTDLFKPGSKIYNPYPEGNLYKGGFGRHDTDFVASGDAVFFRGLREKFGMQHVTTSSSIVYHMQSGEMLNEP